MKSLQTQLADCDRTITENELVLQTLRGLPVSYRTLVNIIPLQKPFPDFYCVMSMLVMEEQRQLDVGGTSDNSSASLEPSRALTAASDRGQPTSQNNSSRTQGATELNKKTT
ncbi:hypothetical protein RND81_07G123200 [Saponaria officinalis]|uniref:Uncharacterized protein n=1 Tax=Saponaria officinalis TaxID=3572 RepID=A0AAW1JMR1_SAPOF